MVSEPRPSTSIDSLGARTFAVVAMAASGLVTLAAVRPLLAILGPPRPGATGGLGDATFDLALVLVFGLQHSLQARATWKNLWIARFPAHTERIGYVLGSCLAFALVVIAWRPLGGTWWQVDDVAGAAIDALGLAGWALALWATLAMSAPDITGLSALREILLGRPFAPPTFRAPGPYRWVRHPIMLGLIVGFFGAATMSADRGLFAASMSLYVVIGILCEERGLGEELGDDYRRYRREVPMLLPWPRPSGKR
ncbi:MAG: isoprenylcysteine carboxylmethyltransferase family protein [bacterium]